MSPGTTVLRLAKLHKYVSTLSRSHLHNSYFSTTQIPQPPIESYVEPSNARIPDDFTFIPNFLDLHEQTILLKFALQKLDKSGSRSYQKRRKGYSLSPSLSVTGDDSPDSLFLPEHLYEFEEKHYDNVICSYRECHLTSWPEHPSLEPIIQRLHSLLPSHLKIQTHLLHLSSDGYIMPHLDNLQASGSWIAAVSLGGPRVLHMEDRNNRHNAFELLLSPGSAYIQRDHVRYSYCHSISQGGYSFKGTQIPRSPRVSIMLRDLPMADSS